MDEMMLKIENVSKQYRLGQIGGTTLREELQRFNAKVRGREDPTRLIGTRDYQDGETFMALDGVSFEVKKGERVGIIGHNGAGKSTLLKLISRITAPTKGTIRLNGRVASMLEVGTGFHGELTGRENIYMNGAILGMTKKEIDAKIEDIIEFSEVRQFIDTPVKRYSSGMYVKLAFSVAAHLDSEIMIMDEVLAVGDMKFQEKCLGKMNDVSRIDKRTILYVSHNMQTIKNLCSRCIVLEKGKVVYDGDVDKAISFYMDNSKNTSRTVYGKDELEWPNKAASLGVKGEIRRVELVGKSSALYSSDEKLQLKVKYALNDPYKEVRIGIQLYSQDHSTIGFGDLILGESSKGEHETDLELDLSLLAEGEFYFRLNIFLTDGLNRYSESIDQTNFICFEISDPPGKLSWEKGWWSSIRLSSFKEMRNYR